MSEVFFARAGRAGGADLSRRCPELTPLQQATISIFGLGCLGAPSALELARAGAGELRLLDPDFVDPATASRWPFGLAASGVAKVGALAEEIERNYPATRVKGWLFRLGSVRRKAADGPQHAEVMRDMTLGTSMILDATAEVGIQQYLSDVAAELRVPYVGVDATPGGWGGHVARVIPGVTRGCWLCYRHGRADGQIASAPAFDGGEIQPPGCGDPTFTGAGFDLLQVALTAVRTVVSTICGERGGNYPAMSWDVTTVTLRTEKGELIPPQFAGYSLERHPECPRCSLA